ncbi:MAG TPA: hypothetical protein VN345_20440 [Blastocatellia bacterium]|nr:hypothetical protein [Blastocatellia bacterium]
MRAIGAAGIQPGQSTFARKLVQASHRVGSAYGNHVRRLGATSARWLVMLSVLGGLAGIDGCKRKVPVTPEDGAAAPQIGRRAPDFTLPAATADSAASGDSAVSGENVSLDQFLGKSTVVLVFYRGYW